MGQSLGWEPAGPWPRLGPLTSITSWTAVYVPLLDFDLALDLTLFYSVCLWCIWEINVPPMTHYLHHDYSFLMTICVLFMQLRLTSLDKILADLIFRSTGLAHSPKTFSKASIQCFYTINLVFQFSLSTLSWWRHLLKRSNIQEEQGSFPPVAEVSSGSKDLRKSSPSLLVMV